MKKIIYFVIAMAFVLLAVIPVFAVDDSTEMPSTIINVVFPISLDFTINPYELDGKAQVYSEVYSIKNMGDTDVIITFSDISVIFENDTDYQLMPYPFDERIETESKAIYLTMSFGRSDIEPIVLIDADTLSSPIRICASQNGESVLNLQISGNVNPYPAVKWKSGDVKIQLNYRVETVDINKDTAFEGFELVSGTAIETIETGVIQ